ncbi:MAG: cytochrome c oxidase subunit 3 [Anaerolineae bacterium]|nr:cytochrome c oxidase subunit 3 [Anaerolineae bacterium]
MASNVVEQKLSREELQALRNKRTGLAIFQVSWIMVFVTLILVNLQLRNTAPSWPPPGVDQLNPAIPTLMTLALIASSFLVRQGTRAVKSGEQARFLSQWRIAIGLGVLFIVVMAIEWITVPPSGQYSDVFRLMVGFHAVHALAIGGFLVHVYRHGTRYNPRHFWPVEAAANLWYFVTVAWLLFFMVLYVI